MDSRCIIENKDMSEHSRSVMLFFDVRFAKVTFTIKFTENTTLVRDKTSAIRGGIGEMLLRSNCIGDRECENCGFEEECLVQRIMYSKLKEKPAYMTSGESLGYIISCENRNTNFVSGDEMSFDLIMFGRNIVYFSSYLNALFALGQNGLGKEKSHFIICGIKNYRGDAILEGENIQMEKYRWETLGDYINYRMRKLENAESLTLQFLTATDIKYHGEEMKMFTADSLKAAIERRLTALCYFEEKPEDIKLGEFPHVISSYSRDEAIYRYSNRKNQKICYNGITGEVRLENVSKEWLQALLAIEVVRVGKNTSFGFGKVRVK